MIFCDRDFTVFFCGMVFGELVVFAGVAIATGLIVFGGI